MQKRAPIPTCYATYTQKCKECYDGGNFGEGQNRNEIDIRRQAEDTEGQDLDNENTGAHNVQNDRNMETEGTEDK